MSSLCSFILFYFQCVSIWRNQRRWTGPLASGTDVSDNVPWEKAILTVLGTNLVSLRSPCWLFPAEHVLVSFQLLFNVKKTFHCFAAYTYTCRRVFYYLWFFNNHNSSRKQQNQSSNNYRISRSQSDLKIFSYTNNIFLLFAFLTDYMQDCQLFDLKTVKS